MAVSYSPFQRIEHHTVQSGFPMDKAGMEGFLQNRPVTAGIYRHLCPDMLTDMQCIVHILFQCLIAGHHRDGPQVDRFTVYRHEDRYCIVMAGIAIQKDRLLFIHPDSPFYPAVGSLSTAPRRWQRHPPP